MNKGFYLYRGQCYKIWSSWDAKSPRLEVRIVQGKKNGHIRYIPVAILEDKTDEDEDNDFKAIVEALKDWFSQPWYENWYLSMARNSRINPFNTWERIINHYGLTDSYNVKKENENNKN